MESSNRSTGDMDAEQTEEAASLLVHLKNLGWFSIIIIILVIVIIHLTLLLRRFNEAAYAICLITHFIIISMLLLWWWKNRIYVTLDDTIQNFGVGYFLISTGVVVMSFISYFLLSKVSSVFGHSAYIMLLFYYVIIGWEEFFKVIYAKKFKSSTEVNRFFTLILSFITVLPSFLFRVAVAHQVAFTSTSAGYATINASAICVFVFIIFSDYHATAEKWIIVACIIGWVLTFYLIFQILSGYMIGLNTTRQLPMRKVGLEPLLFRCLLITLIIPAMFLLEIGVGGILLVITLFLFLTGVFIYRIKMLEKLLPREYLIKVGYLRVFGYGYLPEDEHSTEVQVVQRDSNI